MLPDAATIDNHDPETCPTPELILRETTTSGRPISVLYCATPIAKTTGGQNHHQLQKNAAASHAPSHDVDV